jgi:pimeloyl-ACP methyl ester carboxylesterase
VRQSSKPERCVWGATLRIRLRNYALRSLGIGLGLLQAGCVSVLWPLPDTIPTALIAGDGAHEVLVVVLPGRADDLDGLRRSGIAEAIQQGDPQPDVLLVGATPRYYREGRLTERLREQIVLPARVQGYRRIWLVGASMGGFGAMLYQRRYPDDVDAVLLLAPYMGDDRLIRQIADAGGVSAWDPGPRPAGVEPGNASREIWRVVHGWAAGSTAATPVWLVCGTEDRFFDAAQLMAAALHEEHFIPLSGGHAWSVWNDGARTVFARHPQLPDRR